MDGVSGHGREPWRGRSWSGCAAPAAAVPGDTVMTKDQKIIRVKGGPARAGQTARQRQPSVQNYGLQPGQFLSVQGSLRERRRTGASGAVAPQADPEEPGAASDRGCRGG